MSIILFHMCYSEIFVSASSSALPRMDQFYSQHTRFNILFPNHESASPSASPRTLSRRYAADAYGGGGDGGGRQKRKRADWYAVAVTAYGCAVVRRTSTVKGDCERPADPTHAHTRARAHAHANTQAQARALTYQLAKHAPVPAGRTAGRRRGGGGGGRRGGRSPGARRVCRA